MFVWEEQQVFYNYRPSLLTGRLRPSIMQEGVSSSETSIAGETAFSLSVCFVSLQPMSGCTEACRPTASAGGGTFYPNKQ